MDVNDKKRPRSQNWEEVEKAMLLEYIKEEVNIIENKKKLNIYNKDKFAAWERIKQKMHIEGYSRDTKRIREQWQRMKVQAKRNISMHKNSLKQTGGGPPIPEPTEIEWKIKDLLPYEFTEDYSPFDCDNETEKTPKPSEPSTICFQYPTSPDRGDHSYVHCPTDDGFLNDTIEEGDIDYRLQNEADHEIEEIIITSNNMAAEDPVPVSVKKRKTTRRNMSEYEEKLFALNERRIQQLMRHEEEMHKLKLKHEREYHDERIKLLKLQRNN